MKTAYLATLTEPAPVQHWTPRYGYCTLRGFPPGTDAARLYWERYGIAPPIVLRGLDCVAVGPWEEE